MRLKNILITIFIKLLIRKNENFISKFDLIFLRYYLSSLPQIFFFTNVIIRKYFCMIFLNIVYKIYTCIEKFSLIFKNLNLIIKYYKKITNFHSSKIGEMWLYRLIKSFKAIIRGSNSNLRWSSIKILIFFNMIVLKIFIKIFGFFITSSFFF